MSRKKKINTVKGKGRLKIKPIDNENIPDGTIIRDGWYYLIKGHPELGRLYVKHKFTFGKNVGLLASQVSNSYKKWYISNIDPERRRKIDADKIANGYLRT